MNKSNNRYLFDFQNEAIHWKFPTILFKTTTIPIAFVYFVFKSVI